MILRANLNPVPLQPQRPTPQEASAPGTEHPIRDAFSHIGREVSQEAIVGIALAGMVCLGDSVGHGGAARLTAAGIGAWRGINKYSETATAALDSPSFGKVLAATVGAGTALMCSFQGNVLAGAGYGAMIGLVQAPKSFPG